MGLLRRLRRNAGELKEFPEKKVQETVELHTNLKKRVARDMEDVTLETIHRCRDPGHCKFCGRKIYSFNKHRKSCYQCKVDYPNMPNVKTATMVNAKGPPFKRQDYIKNKQGIKFEESKI